MIRLLKRLLPREPLPTYIHYHVDDLGNEVFCDESACRPTNPPLIESSLHLR